MKRLNCYIAGPLFSDQDRLLLEEIAAHLQTRRIDVYLPHRDGGDLGTIIFSPRKNVLRKRIFGGDLDNIKRADFVVCLLDGQDIDSGASVEMGIAFTLGLPIFALKTDLWRRGSVVNNMVWGVCGSGKTIFLNFKSLCVALDKFIVRRIRRKRRRKD